MTEKTIVQEIGQKLDDLVNLMKPESINEWAGTAEAVFKMFGDKNRIRDFVDTLERIEREIKKGEPESAERKKKIAQVKKLAMLIRKNEPDFLLDSIKRKGFHLSKNSEFRKSIEGGFFRILQQIRLGKRADATHSLMQIFASKKEPMPKEIIEALKEQWHIDQFRAFMYAFLSNFTGKEYDND
jgi:hypothetical protein